MIGCASLRRHRKVSLVVTLIAIEKFLGALVALLAFIFVLVVHIHRSTDPLLMLFPNIISDPPSEAIMRWIDLQLRHAVPSLTSLAIMAGFWALLLGAEAVGLWRNRGWAELLVLLETASFLPFQVWNIVHHPHVTSALTILANLLILIYMAARVRSRQGHASHLRGL